MQFLKNKKLSLKVSHLLTGLILVTSLSSNADSIFLEKNKPAPYSGVLFTEDHAQKLRSELLEKDKLEILNTQKTSEISILTQKLSLKDQEIEAYQTQNSRLVKAEQTSETMKYVWFGLGIFMTGAAVYGARSLAK